MPALPVLFIAAGVILLVCSAFTRIPAWVGAVCVGVGCLIQFV